MATSTEPVEREARPEPSQEGGGEDRSTRRLLWMLMLLLLGGAIALLVLLFWLLRPSPAAAPTAEGGYPIEVVTTIYGSGTEPNELIRTPLGVAFDQDGNVWVSNTGQSRVEQYTADGGFIRMVGDDEDAGQLFAPYGLAVDGSRGRVYVADYAGRAVQIFTTDGGYVGHFPADDQDLKVFGEDGFSPFDVELVQGRVVVASNDGLYFFDESGHVVSRWGGLRKGENVRGRDVGMFNFPDAIAADAETGRLYVADSLNRRIVALGAEGRWLWVSGKPDEGGQTMGFWGLPRGIQVGPDGNIYVVDTFRYSTKGMGEGHLAVLSPEGELLSLFGRSGIVDGSFNFPEQLAAGPDGLWAIADRENNRVVVFRLVTPYPEPSKLEGPKYEGMVDRPEDVWATPSPQPAG